MLNCMAIVESDQGERLGITHKGIGVVEHYLVARRLMTRNIYHYQKKLALEFFLVSLLKSLAENLTDSLFAEIKSTRLGKFLSAVHTFNQQVKTFNNPDTMKKQFLKENYPLYRELCDYDVFAVVKLLSEKTSNHPAAQIAKRLQLRQMPKIVRLDQVDVTTAIEMLDNFKAQHKNTIQDWQINLIKTPHQSYSIDEDAILVVNEQGTVKPINEISLMINAISDKFEHTAFLCIDKSLMQNEKVLQIINQLATTPLGIA
jgi:uncharacterized protein